MNPHAVRSIVIYYYYIDSDGGDDTNLQLYSLKQAKLYWNLLESEVSSGQAVVHLPERCVFIINIIGISVSQLLGQNNPKPSKRVPSPDKIFNSLVDKHKLDPRLKGHFKEFIDTYDHCRHFGLTDDYSRHFQVSQVTFDKTRKIYEFGLLVWDTVIAIYRNDSKNELGELDLKGI